MRSLECYQALQKILKKCGFSRALEFLHFRDDVPEETRGFRESLP
jgi:hypothetical protein